MKCSYCGHLNSLKAVICEKCGEPIQNGLQFGNTENIIKIENSKTNEQTNDDSKSKFINDVENKKKHPLVKLTYKIFNSNGAFIYLAFLLIFLVVSAIAFCYLVVNSNVLLYGQNVFIYILATVLSLIVFTLSVKILALYVYMSIIDLKMKKQKYKQKRENV